MPRSQFVFRDGKCIPKHEAMLADRHLNAKNVSDLPFPYIMGDIEPYRSVIDGSEISGRKQHRDHLRAHGCIEMGNERPKAAGPVVVDRQEIARDIRDAMEKVEAGHKPPPSIVGTKDEEGNVIERPEISDDLPDVIENGSYIRSE